MNTIFNITTKKFKHLEIWVAEAYLNGQQLTFAHGDTKEGAESRLQDKLENHFHVPPKYLNKYASKPLQVTNTGRG